METSFKYYEDQFRKLSNEAQEAIIRTTQYMLGNDWVEFEDVKTSFIDWLKQHLETTGAKDRVFFVTFDGTYDDHLFELTLWDQEQKEEILKVEGKILLKECRFKEEI